MRSLRPGLKATAALSFGFTFLVAQAFAEDCGFLLSSSKSPPPLGDRQLYYRAPGNPGWSVMDFSGADFTGQSVKFAYVIMEHFSEARAGVLVMKSGRLRQMNEPPVRPSAKRVQLVRLPQRFNNGACAPVPPFGERDVSAQSYDDYHDRGLNVPDIKTINAFHFQYASRHGNCRWTNDAAADSISPWDPRSNLGQFSFDQHVVANGTYSQALAWFRPRSAYASSDGLANQRVEMKQYRSVPNQAVCVRFNLAVAGPASFLRIDDLESLSPGDLRYVRSDEQEWRLSH